MASLLDKVNTLIAANLHAMVDRALESNSLKVFDQYIRDAEKNLEDLEDSVATVGGSVKTLKRKYDEVTAEVEKLDRDIDTLLQKGKDDLAIGMQSKLNSKKALAESYYEQYQQQEVEYNKIMDARRKLEARLDNIRQEREQIKALIELVEVKKQTIKATRSLNDLAGVGDADVRRLSENIRANIDKLDAEAEISTERLQNQVDEVIGTSEIEDQLAERRARLGLGNTPPQS